MSYFFVFKRSLLGVKILLKPRPDWSRLGATKNLEPRPLGVKFKISDEHPRLFHMGVTPPPLPTPGLQLLCQHGVGLGYYSNIGQYKTWTADYGLQTTDWV